MTSKALEVEGLTKIYGEGHTAVTAVSEASLDLAGNEFVGLLGPSGSGKTTLISMIGALLTPTDGSVRIGGEDISGMSKKEQTRFRANRIGFVFQSFNLVSVLDAVSNVALPMALAGVPRAERTARAMKLLERFGVAHRSDHLPHRLSGGERQRVALARALANDPAVVFADEPTGNLDSKSGEVVVRALRDVAAEGRTVVIVTHDRDLADLADARIELRDGEVRGVSGPRADDVRPADTAQAGPVGAA